MKKMIKLSYWAWAACGRQCGFIIHSSLIRSFTLTIYLILENETKGAFVFHGALHTHKIGRKYLRDVSWALLSWPSEVFYRSLLGNSLYPLCVLHFAMQHKAFHSIKVDFHCRVIFTGGTPENFTLVNEIEAMYERPRVHGRNKKYCLRICHSFHS